jgi:hypothetical protein
MVDLVHNHLLGTLEAPLSSPDIYTSISRTSPTLRYYSLPVYLYLLYATIHSALDPGSCWQSRFPISGLRLWRDLYTGNSGPLRYNYHTFNVTYRFPRIESFQHGIFRTTPSPPPSVEWRVETQGKVLHHKWRLVHFFLRPQEFQKRRAKSTSSF